MGNHDAGRSMGRMAESLIKRRLPSDKAIDLLDEICRPYSGCDAEFEAEDPNKPGHIHPDFTFYTDPEPGAALGMLMVEAFAPNGLEDISNCSVIEENNADEFWRTKVYEPFQKRYKFC